MLPPDSPSTVLPWRVAVGLMQVYGCFPYRVLASNERHTFSVALCLWSIFQQLYILALNCMSFRNIYVHNQDNDLGTATFIGITSVAMIGFSLAPSFIAIESSKLANLLHNMSDIRETSLPPTYRWYCKPKTVLFLISAIAFSVYLVWTSYNVLGLDDFIGIIISCHACVIWCIGYLLPVEVFSLVFDLLARRLVAATETTAVKISKLLASDGSFKYESDVQVAMQELRDLDAVIQEV